MHQCGVQPHHPRLRTDGSTLGGMGEPVFHDGSEIEHETEPDDQPRSGVWVDSPTGSPTDEELAEGERQGREIDLDDDEDNGL